MPKHGVRFRSLIVFALILAGAVIVSCGEKGTSGHRILRLGHGLDVAHPVHLALVDMAERVARYSDGRLEVRVYPGEQLGPERDMIEQLQLGLVDMTKISASPLESFVPETAVFSLPYVFRDRDHYWTVLDGPIGDRLLAAGEKRGIRGLAYYDSGSRSFYAKKEIPTPADLAGLKVRVQQSRTSMDMVTALGGSPTPLSFGELYTALQQGVVDAAENNLPSYHLSRHFEVCPHYSMDEHTRTPDVVLISEETWQSLSPEDRAIIQRAARESSHIERELWTAMEATSLAYVVENGATIHQVDTSLFRESVQEMLDSYDGTELGDVLDQIAAVESGS